MKYLTFVSVVEKLVGGFATQSRYSMVIFYTISQHLVESIAR